jgi:ligand-binding sensor domain-containing protein
VWDLAFGPGRRLFAGRSNGLVWADDLAAEAVEWQTAGDMEKVYFLSVNPHPVEPQLVWAGTWGNNIGASNNGGERMAPLHNGLETLSGLDLIWHPTPGQVTLATFEGLYRTDDGGQSWFKLPGPLMQQTIYSLLQTDDGTIWAGAANGLWVSRDYGTTWAMAHTMLTNTMLANTTLGNNIPQAAVLRLGKLTALQVPPSAPQPASPPFVEVNHVPLVYAPHEWLWAGTERAGLWISPDNGITWHFGGLPEQTVFNVFFDPLHPHRLIAATDQGIFTVDVSDSTPLD